MFHVMCVMSAFTYIISSALIYSYSATCYNFTGISSVSPVQSSTIQLLPSTSTKIPSSSETRVTVTPTVTSTILPSSSTLPSETTPPVPNTNDNTLVAAVVGAVGGVVVLLLVLVIILFIAILAKRRQTTDKYDIPQQNK